MSNKILSHPKAFQAYLKVAIIFLLAFFIIFRVEFSVEAVVIPKSQNQQLFVANFSKDPIFPNTILNIFDPDFTNESISLPIFEEDTFSSTNTKQKLGSIVKNESILIDNFINKENLAMSLDGGYIGEYKVIQVNRTPRYNLLSDIAIYSENSYCLDDIATEFSNGVHGEIKDERNLNGLLFTVTYLSGEESRLNEFLNKPELIPYVDLLAAEVPFAQVHAGFFREYQNASLYIHRRIARFIFLVDDRDKKPIFFTGHSLGGVYATFAALVFKKAFPKRRIYVITYGQPRIGNQHFANYVDNTLINPSGESTVYRVIFSNDNIPHLPISQKTYTHPGIEYWIKSRDQTTFECPGLKGTENQKCSNSVKDLTRNAHNGPYFGIIMGSCIALDNIGSFV
ncbi:hypothetical protein G9A89_006523 [Geosiphon pyriformis]|nr:hypothetical protein G9A89_006523 [Geosiphon pyriformis]